MSEDKNPDENKRPGTVNGLVVENSGDPDAAEASAVSPVSGIFMTAPSTGTGKIEVDLGTVTAGDGLSFEFPKIPDDELAAIARALKAQPASANLFTSPTNTGMTATAMRVAAEMGLEIKEITKPRITEAAAERPATVKLVRDTRGPLLG